MARYVLQEALTALLSEGKALLAELHELEGAISLLDHRRFDAECRRAEALLAAAPDRIAVSEIEISLLIAEHGRYVVQGAKLRDEVLRRLDGAILRSEPAKL